MYRSLRQPPTTRPRRDRTRWHRAVSSRHDDERLSDIIDAINAIRSHIARGDLSDGLIFDAVRVRLIEIGEAVKALDPELVASEPAVKWADAAGMRDWLAHHCFDTSRATVEVTILPLRQPFSSCKRVVNSLQKNPPTYRVRIEARILVARAKNRDAFDRHVNPRDLDQDARLRATPKPSCTPDSAAHLGLQRPIRDQFGAKDLVADNNYLE